MVKLAFRGGAALGVLVLARLGIGALVLWIALAVRRTRVGIPAGRWPGIWLLGGLSAGVGVFLFGATERIPASTTTLVLYAYPAIVAALSLGLGRERLHPLKLVALVLGLVGVLLVLGAPTGRLDVAGVVLALAAALCLALYVLAAQTVTAEMSPFAAGALILTTATVVYVPVGAVTGGLSAVGSGAAWWWPVGIGTATGAAIALFLAGLARLGPIRAAIGSTIEPVAAVVLAALFLSEVLSGLQLIGAGLVVAAVATLPLARGAEGAEAPRPGPPMA